jgi:hypothetical protein
VAHVGGEEERTCYNINEEFMERMKAEARAAAQGP